MFPLLLSLFMLDTNTTRLSIDETRKGAIVSVMDKASGHDFAPVPVTPNTPKPLPPFLYEIFFTDPAKPQPPSSITEADAIDSTVTKDGDVITITAMHHRRLDASVRCTFRTVAGSPYIHARIAVKNNSNFPITTVRFPMIASAATTGDAAANEYLLLPVCDGYLVQNPAAQATMPDCTYPGTASMQCFALYTPTAGLYVAAQDPGGYRKAFSAYWQRNTAYLRTSHYPPTNITDWWETNYDMVIGTFRGDWQQAATMYKAWAVKQPWCAQMLSARVAAGEIPRWITDPSLFNVYSVRTRVEPRLMRPMEARLDTVAPVATAWRKLLGIPVTDILMGWEKQDFWATPDYFPPFGGDEAFRAATVRLRAQGDHSLVFISGLRWTLNKTKTAQLTAINNTPAFQRDGAGNAITNIDGSVAKWGSAGSDTGEYAQICAATPYAHTLLNGITGQLRQLGIDSVQIDQLVGGGQPVCYNTQHGHPPGGGNWATKAVYDLLDDVRRQGKKDNANYAISIEEPNEYFIPVLDIYHARDYQQGRWPREGSNAIGVPLFTYVYHEYLYGYGGDTANVTPGADPVNQYKLAMNLLNGKAPASAVWERTLDPNKVDPIQLRILRGHAELLRGPAHDYLTFGQRLASTPLQAPTVTIKFPTTDPKQTRDITFPAVMHSVWQLPDGRTGTVYVSIAAEDVTVTLDGKPTTFQPGEVRFNEANPTPKPIAAVKSGKTLKPAKPTDLKRLKKILRDARK